MTSRVEAVRKALAEGFRVMPDQGTYTWQEMAEIAIEASDAWLKARPTWVCPNCGTQEPYPYQAECRGCGDFNPYSETIS